MTRVLVLDTGPAGQLAHPRVDPNMAQRIVDILDAGDVIVLPEIVDYELRRNLLLEIARGHSSMNRSLDRLDQLRRTLTFLPINSDAMLKAAELWAEARRQGRPTADPQALDGDAILAAQALQVGGTVVTLNIGHLRLFVDAVRWEEI
ncbi:MAG: PIN domain-containing protein [Chloroflexota bacterium]|nr:PIN domain-containing protein [Chloroflexota bacterium]